MKACVLAMEFGLVALLMVACGGSEEVPSMVSRKAAASTDSVENRKPVIEFVRLSPSSPGPGDRVTARVEASDADGDHVEIVYQWRVNGSLVDESGASLPVGNIAKGGVIEVTAIARDGKEQGAPVRAMVRVGNTAPLLQGVVIEPLGEITANSDVSASPRATDPDGDSISFNYVWKVNGRNVGGNSPVLLSQHFKRGDEIRITVTASDAEASSPALSSDAIRVVNAPPRIVSVPGTFDDDGIFRYALKAEDLDGDRLFRYRLEKGPAGMKMDIVNGRLVWEPRQDQSGVHPVLVTVDDRSGGIGRQGFDVRVEFETGVPASAGH